MAYIEKVISDFERWIDLMDEDAPVVALDALELLKEQQETIKRLTDKLFVFPDAWIHCKDCKFRHMDEHGIWFCENHDVYPEEDWFCADGEKRNEE